MYYIIYKTTNRLLNSLPVKKRTPVYRQILVILWIFIARGVIGGILYESIAVRLFVFLPTVFALVFEEDEEKNETMQVSLRQDTV